MAADGAWVRRLRTREPDKLALADEARDVTGLALATAWFVAAVTIDAVTPRLPLHLGLTLEVGGARRARRTLELANAGGAHNASINLVRIDSPPVDVAAVEIAPVIGRRGVSRIARTRRTSARG
jgi:hypothetical protein